VSAFDSLRHDFQSGKSLGAIFPILLPHAVIGGLISSTLLTLVLVPVVLTYLDGFGRRAASLFPKGPDSRAAEKVG